MKKIFVVMIAAVLAACGGSGTVSGPEPETKQEVETSAPLKEPVTVAPDPSEGFIECRVGFKGSYFASNRTRSPQPFVAWWTDFDNQSLPRGSSRPFVAQPGDFSLDGTFDRTCVQDDVSNELNGRPYCFGFINHEGKVVHPSKIDRAACAPKRPTPEPEKCRVPGEGTTLSSWISRMS